MAVAASRSSPYASLPSIGQSSLLFRRKECPEKSAHKPSIHAVLDTPGAALGNELL
jgi:hypothetical protein